MDLRELSNKLAYKCKKIKLIFCFFFSSGRRETQAHYAEARLRAQKYSREMNQMENTSTMRPDGEHDDLSSEDSDFELEEDGDGFLDGDEDDEEVLKTFMK